MPSDPEKKLINEQIVVEALKKVGATEDCPRCGQNSFKILPGFFVHSVQTSTKGVQLGGPGLATWVVVCTNCGFLSQHAAEILTGVNEIEAIKH